ncbi:MAG: PAS domain-containing protein [Pseudomonadota bacterium]
MEKEHKRINEKLQNYWEKLRGKRLYPEESEINPDEIKDIWEDCFLLNIKDDEIKHGYKYTYLGNNLIEAFGGDITFDGITNHLLDTSYNPLIKSFESVSKNGIPIIDSSEFKNKNNMLIKYRSCIFPLGDSKNNNINFLIGAMKWKAF